jgi:hypothetical protein
MGATAGDTAALMLLLLLLLPLLLLLLLLLLAFGAPLVPQCGSSSAIMMLHAVQQSSAGIAPAPERAGSGFTPHAQIRA